MKEILEIRPESWQISWWIGQSFVSWLNLRDNIEKVCEFHTPSIDNYGFILAIMSINKLNCLFLNAGVLLRT